MTAHVLRRPFSFDPLIAEAKRRTRQRRLSVAVATVMVAGATLGTTVAPREPSGSGGSNAVARQLPSLLVNSGPRGLYRWKVRPADAWILFTGDGSGRLGGSGGTDIAHPGHPTWQTWTNTQATGSGVVWLDDMVQRSIKTLPVTVRAFRPVNGHFTRLTLRYSDAGKHYVDTRTIGRGAGVWSYGSARITTGR